MAEGFFASEATAAGTAVEICQEAQGSLRFDGDVRIEKDRVFEDGEAGSR